MKKRILQVSVLGLLIFGLHEAYDFYLYNKEKKRRASYYENLSDTSSPTVISLRDSIRIEYQNQYRAIHIYVPPNYEKDTSARYPVIYMLDGESSFNDLENMSPEWQIDEVINQAHDNGKQTAIVIGINQAENRDAEYTPFVNPENPDAHGAQFTEWIVNELKPWVDSNYRTNTDAKSTTIGGISRSGMMAYYIIMTQPDFFGNALIQSPSMWVDYDRLMAMQLSVNQLKYKKFFISVGEKEGDMMISHAESVYNKFETVINSDQHVRFEIIPNEGHWHITWRKSFALAFPWLMMGF
ncbi:MAG: alpha/beta hydrolase-fold protein [Bacteroidota bacterium]